jgi:predicted nucleotidyltransferase component of viral defense system
MTLDINVQKMIEMFPDSMPQADKLREVLQQTALLGLARHRFFEHAAFYGGTALRILYGLDRYSEDLDFTLLKSDPEFNFSPFLEGMNKELESFGFQLKVSVHRKNQDSGIWSAFLKANTLQLLLQIQERSQPVMIHPEQKIQIKLEIDTEPPEHKLKLESRLVKNPIPFYITTLQQKDLFAGKLHAALCRRWKKRIKGRDWYDFVWYLQNKIPVNLVYLRKKMVQTGHLSLDETIDKKQLQLRLNERIDEIDWEIAKKDVAPFIPDSQRLELWSSSFFHDLTQHLLVD